MTAISARYTIRLVEEPSPLPIRSPRRPARRPPLPRPRPRADLTALLEAVDVLRRRGADWRAPLADNPLAFLLDALSDAVVIRDEAERPIFANRSAEAFGSLPPPPVDDLEQLELEGVVYERRSHTFAFPEQIVKVEIIKKRS